uniref:Uncharacterized protein LOC111109406 isoform X2 n=1 Tax=Crassostrea virginica TaxID=6565 RepID=A0A8B8BCQ8_CRAVI|nr:uncharacterized protein LOC111109406 isoform X2 [Crassostrea virginica]
MPPRKRKARAAPKPAKKRVNTTTRATSQTPLPEAMDSSAPSQLLDNNNAVIDYDQLAAAIIRQQQQAATFSSPVEANPAPAASGSTNGECQPFINTLQQFFSGSQEICPMFGPTASNSTRSYTLYLSQSSLQLLIASVSTSTKQLYLRSYTLIHKFCAIQNVPFSLPFTEVLICNFIGDLFQQGYSSSTITSHVSAISYLHKLFNLPDPTHSFIVRKTIKGTHNLAKSGDIRLPITKTIICPSSYTSRGRYKSAFVHNFPSCLSCLYAVG